MPAGARRRVDRRSSGEPVRYPAADMSSLVRWMFDSADRWRVPHRLVVALTAVAIGGVIVLPALFFLHRPTFRLMLDEDGIVEWGQVLLWAGAAASGVLIARDRWRSGHRVQALLWIGFVLAALFVIGEEISWGQRLLGLATLAELEEINRQNELNVHNIGRALLAFNVVLVLASLYAIAAEWIERRWHLAGRFADGARLYVPPFFLWPLFAIMVGFRVIRWTVLSQESYALTKLSEWAELCFIGALSISVWLSARWLRGKREGLDVGD